MAKQQFFASLQQEIARIDAAKVSKRNERVIEGFTADPSPKAVIQGKNLSIFNSNDYLGLRHHQSLKQAEHTASEKYGTGPGAVRFISGSLQIHRDLEKKIAQFHGRDDALVFSSAFATNMAVLFCLLKGQSKDSVVSGNTLVVSDELNHRSIIDGIRVAGLESTQKAVFRHFDANHLAEVLEQNKGKFDRVIVVSDGVFSMLGEYQDLSKIRVVIDKYDEAFKEGVLLVVDDAHGVGAFGKTGRGTEEVSNAKADVLIGTLGKAFGADGGYVTGDQVVMDYLRESAATYIYSNSISPGTAGAALAALSLMETEEGVQLLQSLEKNVKFFKENMLAAGFTFAADSIHPIQPLLIGDADKTKALTNALYDAGFLVTNINYPVVPKGKDEIRVQISASHTQQDLENFLAAAQEAGKLTGVLG